MKASQSWRYLIEAYQVCTQKYSVFLQGFDLTPSQLDILVQIEHLGDDARPKSIAEGLLVTRGNITNMTKRLIERGFIQQHGDPHDKRSAILSMTERGAVVLQQAKKAAHAFIDQQLAPFSNEEIQLVGLLMLKMRKHLESNGFADSLLATQRELLPEVNAK